MFWFRSFAVGLLGACCLLLATRPQTALVLGSPPPIFMMPPPQQCDEPPPPKQTTPVTVIDVAPGVTGTLVAQLIVLAANERITAIDDVRVDEGRATLAALGPLHRQYVDVAITSDAGAMRRVLVLAR
jgi:hypothetical protein